MEQGEERKNIKYVTFETEISLKSMASHKAVQNDRKKKYKNMQKNKGEIEKAGCSSKREQARRTARKGYYFAALAALMASMSRGVTLNRSPQMP